MSTKSNRSAGTQHTQKGVTQGITLVDPKTGNPVNVILGQDGKYRLAVDATVTATVGNIDVNLDGVGPGADNVYLVDNNTGAKFKINSDGSIDVNVEVDAADGDNVAISDGINTASVNANNELLVKDTDVETAVNSVKTEVQSSNTKLDSLITNTNDIENLITSTNSLLTTIRDNADQVETLLGNINSNTDTVEALITSTNALLTQIRDNADTLETLIGTSNTQLTAINANTDNIESLITATNALLTTIRDNADTLESLVTTSNTQLSAINSNTDGLEGLLGTTNSLLTTIRDNADTLESLITTSNSLLTAIGNNTDTLEALITSTNTKLDTVNTNLTNIQTEIDSAQYTMNESFSKATAIAGQLDDVGTTAATENNVAPVRITAQRAIHSNLRDPSGVDLTKTTTPSLTNSSVVVRPIPYEPATYSASAVGFASATTATDVWNITGSASKTIRVHTIIVTGSTTSGSPIKVNVQLIKRSTVDTAGTSVANAAVPHDSASAAATATVKHYTANPTLGTAVGPVRAAQVAFNQGGITGGDITWEFTRGQPLLLKTVNEQLCVNFSSTTVTGAIICIHVEWSEV